MTDNYFLRDLLFLCDLSVNLFRINSQELQETLSACHQVPITLNLRITTLRPLRLRAFARGLCEKFIRENSRRGAKDAEDAEEFIFTPSFSL